MAEREGREWPVDLGLMSSMLLDELNDVMDEALALAALAAGAGDVPVGALVLDASGAIIGRGYNTREAGGDPLAHAEVIAMRAAAETRGGDWNLADYTLVVTLEPCPMCAGAAVSAHVGRVVFGAWDPQMGACGSVWDIPRDPHIGFSPEVHGGVRERECAALLSDWFAAHRIG